MARLSLVALLTLAIAPFASADEGVLTDDLRNKLEGVDLSGYQPEGKAASEAKGEDGAQQPAGVTDQVWAMIDANKNGQATDREAFAAAKPLRVFANVKKSPTPAHVAMKQAADADENGIVTLPEAIDLISKVRMERCPTARRAQAYFTSLDTDHSGSIGDAEVLAVLNPLGNVGRHLAQPLSVTLKEIDLDKSKTLEPDEVSFSANAFLRMELATTGNNVANRRPDDWLRIVSGVMALDADADNQVSQVEASQLRVLASNFAKIDRSSDGHLSASEICDYQAALDEIAAAQARARAQSFCAS